MTTEPSTCKVLWALVLMAETPTDYSACRVAAGPLPAMGVKRGPSAVQKAPADPKAILPQTLKAMNEFCPWNSACWSEGRSLEHVHLLLKLPKALVPAAPEPCWHPLRLCTWSGRRPMA